jgi:hypothetical protein
MTPRDRLLLLLLGVALMAGSYLLKRRATRRTTHGSMPTSWPSIPRSALNSDERRALRMLRDAMPQHIVLASLPLVRLCQPRDGLRSEYWYDLLAPLHVSFAVCSPNGSVLAVIDLETPRNTSRRVATIKQAVMAACRIRYISCRPENLPPPSELQLLLPNLGGAARAVPMRALPGFHQARSSLPDTVRARRAERSARWADSGLPQDSFFAPGSPLYSGSGDFSHSVSPAFDTPLPVAFEAEPARYRN